MSFSRIPHASSVYLHEFERLNRNQAHQVSQHLPYRLNALSCRRVEAFSVKSPLLTRYISKYGIEDINSKPLVRKENLKTMYQIKLGKPSNQGNSGRCWIFSGLNMMRIGVLSRYGEEFHYSHNFVAFWDKLERANYFLEKMIEMRNIHPLDIEIRDFSNYLITDGGQWEYFCNIVKKYGLVPDYAMPETEFSRNSVGYMETLKCRLSEVGGVIHQLAKADIKNPKIQEIKNQALNEVYSILTKYLGIPPKSFVWNESNDTAKCSMDAESDQEDYFPYEIKEEESGEDVIVTHNLRMPKMLTPLEFYRRSKVDLDEIVHLTHIPYHEENMVLEGKEIKNMVGGKEFRGLNVNIDVIIQAIFQSIINGNAVPMAADVKHLDERVNFFSIQNDLKDEIFDFDSSIKLSKGDRLLYGATSCAHLMNIVGCDDPVENKLPVGIEEEYGRLWKIENSWEDQDELIMSDSWLREYGYEFFILKKYLPENLQRVWDNPKDRVKEITPQDPIGKF